MSERIGNEVGIVVYPGSQTAAVHGLTDLFGIASNLALKENPKVSSPLRVTHWQPAPGADSRPQCVYDSAPDGHPEPWVLVIPPTMVNVPDPELPIGTVSWIRERHAAGAIIASVCSGAFMLARTGLADGRPIATHQVCQAALSSQYPKVIADASRRIIDCGDIVSAGGYLAWIDIGLFLIERILGAVVKNQTAHLVLSSGGAGEAPYLVGFSPPRTHGDREILHAQDWVLMRDGREVSVASMAIVAGLQRRTFLRRFVNAVGMTPVDYCRQVRIAFARELLISGNTPLKVIAESAGYKDVASFARVFRKAMGSAPGAYRTQFGVPPAGYAPETILRSGEVTPLPARP